MPTRCAAFRLHRPQQLGGRQTRDVSLREVFSARPAVESLLSVPRSECRAAGARRKRGDPGDQGMTWYAPAARARSANKGGRQESVGGDSCIGV